MIRIPGESSDYRKARNRLLTAELKLREQVEKVAKLRRALPPGGEIPEDYPFVSGGAKERVVRLSELFRPGHRTLVVYNFMYGPKMKSPCTMCTAFLDSLEGNAAHIEERVSLAVVAASDAKRIGRFARSRGWSRLRLFSSKGTSFQPDYHGQTSDGYPLPMLHVFVRSRGGPRHFWSTEMFHVPNATGRDQRHIDQLWPLWNVFDLTPEGRGDDWYPALKYKKR